MYFIYLQSAVSVQVCPKLTPDLLTNTTSIMKLFPLLNFAHIVDFNVLSRIARTQISTYSKNGTSINTAIKSNILRSHSPNINYPKPFDTAVLTYHIMGLSKFELSVGWVQFFSSCAQLDHPNG